MAVEDYPRDWLEFEVRFSTEAACREYLWRLCWPDGFWCPRCGATKNWPKAEGLVRCAGCDYQASVTAGTVFQDSRLSLTLWFRTAWWMTSQKNGVSAMGLQQVLGLKSYKTAWAMLHKLTRAMVRPIGIGCRAAWKWTRLSSVSRKRVSTSVRDNIPFNYLTGPGFNELDLGLYKVTPLWRTVKLHFAAQFFNAHNHINLGLPNNKGVITAGVTNGLPRTIQLQAKVAF